MHWTEKAWLKKDSAKLFLPVMLALAGYKFKLGCLFLGLRAGSNERR